MPLRRGSSAHRMTFLVRTSHTDLYGSGQADRLTCPTARQPQQKAG